MSKFFPFFIFLFLCFSIQAETMDDEENDYQVTKDRIIPSTPANVSNQPNRVIIHEKPQNPAFKVSEQPPTQVYSSPILRQEDRLSLERKKMEKETERTLRERLELLRLKDEQKRLNRLAAPMDSSNVAVPKNVQQPQQPPFSQSFKASYTPPRPYYISLGLGRIFFSELEVGEAPYSNSHIPNRVHSGYLFSAGLGLYTGTRLSFGYLFNFSKHRMTHPDIVTQENRFSLYTHSALLKFSLFPGKLKPFIGAIVSLNQRTAWPDYTTYSVVPIEVNHYFSFYGGPSAGVDLFLGSRIGFSIIISYMMNVYRFQNQNEYERLNPPIVESNIEKMSRISTNASLKFLF